jgi:hypothetical protein
MEYEFRANIAGMNLTLFRTNEVMLSVCGRDHPFFIVGVYPMTSVSVAKTADVVGCFDEI